MKKSELHKSTCSIIKECYPKEPIIEEHPIKIGSKTLYLDIYLPRLNVAFEADGEQHSKFNKFFHADIFAFQAQKKNDKEKEEYCQENAIVLIRIKFDDKINKEFITNKILAAFEENK